jgi:hypothetical protein
MHLLIWLSDSAQYSLQAPKSAIVVFATPTLHPLQALEPDSTISMLPVVELALRECYIGC